MTAYERATASKPAKKGKVEKPKVKDVKSTVYLYFEVSLLSICC